ncbi:MAG: hypothetical protein ACRD29_18255 [Acidimicrobiales bacterium]
MARQLALIETEPDWRLDDDTREIGREGIAQAREALRAALQEARSDRATAA